METPPRLWKVAATLAAAVTFGATVAAAAGEAGALTPDEVVTPSALVATADGWQLETVAAHGDDVVMAMDAQGRPHLAYITNEKPRGAGDDAAAPYLSTVKYARPNGAAWELFTVAQAPALANGESSYQSPALALDDKGNPHLAYVAHKWVYGQPAPYSVVYAHSDGGKWVAEEVDATGAQIINNVVLALDPQGRAAVSYVACYPDAEIAQVSILKFARRGPGGWETEDLHPEEYFGSTDRPAPSAERRDMELLEWKKFLGVPVRLTFGADGRAFIFFTYGLSGQGSAYATGSSGSWSFTAVPGGGGDAVCGPDDAGRLYAAYCMNEHPYYASVLARSLKYATCADGQWVVETVDDRSDAGNGVSLAVDADGLPYLAYFNSYSLMFAHRAATGWVRQTLWDYKKDVMVERTAIGLDNRGYPVVAFTDAAHYELKVARWPGGEWRDAPPGEGPRDLSGAAGIQEWDPYARAWLAGEPWPGTKRNGEWGPELFGALRAEPREDAAETGEIPGDADDPITILEVRSVRTAVSFDPITEGEVYEVWLKVRAGDTVGWNKAEMYEGPALVRFTQPAGPFRTAAAADAPPIKAEKRRGWGSLTRDPKTDELYQMLLWWNGRACLNGGWLPADTPGMEVYWLTASWSVSGDVLWYTFYFPVAGDVTRIYVAMGEYMGAGKAGADPAFTVITAHGEIAAAVREVGADYGYESGTTYYEAALPRPVARDDILAFTYAVGEGENRVMMKLDPRPAWAGP